MAFWTRNRRSHWRGEVWNSRRKQAWKELNDMWDSSANFFNGMGQ